MVNFVSIEEIDQSCVVHVVRIVINIVRIGIFSARTVDTVDLTRGLLGQLHENDRAFVRDCVDHQSRQDDDED